MLPAKKCDQMIVRRVGMVLGLESTGLSLFESVFSHAQILAKQGGRPAEMPDLCPQVKGWPWLP